MTATVVSLKDGMAISNVFMRNPIQAVRLPAALHLPENLRPVDGRVVRNERIMSPVENTWDSFFINGSQGSEDFIPLRASQEEEERQQGHGVNAQRDYTVTA